MTQNASQSQTHTLGASQPAPREAAGQERPLCEVYECRPTAWDELFAEAGAAHDYCAPLAQKLGESSAAEFQRL